MSRGNQRSKVVECAKCGFTENLPTDTKCALCDSPFVSNQLTEASRSTARDLGFEGGAHSPNAARQQGPAARYKAVPFVARIESTEDVGAAASQLERLINKYAAEGWKYVRVESVEINQAGDAGCFGIGATPGAVIRYDMVVFERQQ